MVLTTFVENTKAKASEVNDNFSQCYTRLLDSDSTAASTTSTGTTFTTLAVGAGEVTSYVMITVNCAGKAVSASDADVTVWIDVQAGETGSEVRIDRYQLAKMTSSGENTAHPGYRAITLVYEPTTDEKTNGFNVIIKSSITTAGSSVGTCYYQDSYLTGA